MGNGINTGNTEEVVDQAARTRSSRGYPNPAFFNHVDNVTYGEEVAGETEVGDGSHFLLKSVLRNRSIIGSGVAQRQFCFTPAQ